MAQSRIKDYLKKSIVSPTKPKGTVNIKIGEHNMSSDDEETFGAERGLGDLEKANMAAGDAITHAQSEPDVHLFSKLLQQQQQMMDVMASMLPETGTKRAAPSATATITRADINKKARPEVCYSEDLEEDDEMDVDDKMADWLQVNEDEKTCEDGHDPDIYADIKSFFESEEKLGREVSEPTAQLVDAAMRSVVSGSKEKELTDKVCRPGNCASLVVPKINPEIWRQLKRETRETDVNYQRVQTLINKGLGPLVTVMDVLRSKGDKENLLMLGDAFRLLALSSSRLSQRRKDAVATDLKPNFRQLCAPGRPVTALLFGDDLQKSLKDIKESQSLGNNFAGTGFRGSSRGRYFRGSPKFDAGGRGGFGHSRGRGFLGGRGQYSQRRRGSRQSHQQSRESGEFPQGARKQ